MYITRWSHFSMDDLCWNTGSAASFVWSRFFSSSSLSSFYSKQHSVQVKSFCMYNVNHK